jgi:hypothetical protein
MAAPLAFALQLFSAFTIGIVPCAISIFVVRLRGLELLFYAWVPTAVFILMWRRSTRGFAVGLWLSYVVYFAHAAGYLGPSRRDRDTWQSDLGTPAIRALIDADGAARVSHDGVHARPVTELADAHGRTPSSAASKVRPT